MNIKIKSMYMQRQRLIQLSGDEMQSPETSSPDIVKNRGSATRSPTAIMLYTACEHYPRSLPTCAPPALVLLDYHQLIF